MVSSSEPLPKINAAMFEESPVWAGGYDEGFTPVFHSDPLPEDLGNLYIKVDFTTPRGIHLAGCVSAPARHFVAIFVGDSGFYFNSRVQPQESEVAELNRLVPELKGTIFPLRYETNYRFAGQPTIVGSFTVPGG